MRALSVPLPFLIVCLSLALMPGCREGGSRTHPSNFPPHLRINYTANTVGELYPCGCRIPMGGLSRRGGVLAEEDPYPHLTLDAGSFASGNSGYDRFTAGWILRMYVEMGYDAVNLGTYEAVQPVSQIREWDQIAGGILISANLIDSQGLPVTRRSLIREVGGIKIGITGVTMEPRRPQMETEMPEVLVPVPSLQEVIADFEEKGVDFVILLADTGTAETDAILAEVPGIDFVIQGREFNSRARSASREVEAEEGSSRVVKIGDRGKRLGRIRLDFEPDGTIIGEEVVVVELDNTAPTLASVTELLLEYKAELRERRDEFIGDPGNPFRRDAGPEMVDVVAGFTGPGFCFECHPGYEIGQDMVGHMEHAWIILDSEHKNDPDCLACHSTGYGLPTGMQDPFRETHLRGVTCEACHGPAALHVREMNAAQNEIDPSTMLPAVDPTGLEFRREVPADVCMACHIEEWSPDFDYDAWLPRVDHSWLQSLPSFADRETGRSVPVPQPDGDSPSSPAELPSSD